MLLFLLFQIIIFFLKKPLSFYDKKIRRFVLFFFLQSF